jgi:thiamine biosynthesis lipoprotein
MLENEFAESESLGMGTVVSHRAWGASREAALRAAAEETERLEKLLSRFLPGSDIGRLNGAAGLGPVAIAAETMEVLTRAVEFSERSRGAFDVTVCPLVDLWNVLNRTSAPADSREIRRTLPLVDYRSLVLDPVRGTAALTKRGQSADLGGIGKGYAADRITGIFRAHGITSAYTNFGGNVAALGNRPDGAPWRVGIRHPRKSGELIGAVSVSDKSVVTSGDYQRFFVASDGRRYHHILDPRTGYPSKSGLVSATVVSGCSLEADALSTVLFVLGLEKGLEIMRRYPGSDAVLIDEMLTVFITEGLAGAFEAPEGVRAEILDI